MKKVFSGANIYPNYFLEKGSHEKDLLVQFGDVVILIECKNGRLREFSRLRKKCLAVQRRAVRDRLRVPNDSVESQKYGKEVWNVLYEHHVVAPLIYAGGEEDFVGTWVCVVSALDKTGKAGEDFQIGMDQLDMGTRFRDRYWAAADNGFVIWIGTKEPYD